MATRQLVLAVSPDEASADEAVASLKAWDRLEADVKLDAIGVLVLDDQGRVKMQKVGSRSTSKGAAIGVALAMLTPVGLAAGLLGGAVLGAVHHKNLGLDAASSQRLEHDLREGKAAVGVLADDDDAADVSSKLAELGGTPQALPVDEAKLAAGAEETAAMFGGAPSLANASGPITASANAFETPSTPNQD